MNRNNALVILAAFLSLVSLSAAALQIKDSFPSAVRSLRIEFEDGCALIARPSENSSLDGGFQLLLQKPGGSLLIVDTFSSLKIVDLISADLDGDGFLEIAAIAMRRAGDDVMPFVFRYTGNIERLFPQDTTEDNPITGREITIIPTKSGMRLCVKVPIRIYNFGPPDLIKTEIYRVYGNKLEKVDETLCEAAHYNQIMNRGALFMRRGDYSAALKDYESIIASQDPQNAPDGAAKLEALAAAAECMMHLKNFRGALELYKRITHEFPTSPKTQQALDYTAFLERHIERPQELSIYIDILKANRENRWNDAINLCENAIASFSKNFDDRFISEYAEALIASGRIKDALLQYKQLQQEYPNSILIESVQERIKSLDNSANNLK